MEFVRFVEDAEKHQANCIGVILKNDKNFYREAKEIFTNMEVENFG